MKQLVVLSGKGGTGKTSVTAAFSHLASMDHYGVKAVLADADVDASNLELVVGPQKSEPTLFQGGKVAVIDQTVCAGCGTCHEVCRFDAVYENDYKYRIDPIACDGCAACYYQCPEDAIKMEEQIAGEWFQSESLYGPLFHASLKPGGENSGKLVTLVKQNARLLALDNDLDLVLVDGPPGIGCPVISAASGADLALIVAEPTAAGTHDMKRVLSTTNHFGIKALVCINKADIYTEGSRKINSFCQEQGVEVVGQIPFDLSVPKAMVKGQAVTAYDPNAKASQAVIDIWELILGLLFKEDL